MDHLNDAELMNGYEVAGLDCCLKCGRLYKIDDDGCNLCSEEEVMIAA